MCVTTGLGAVAGATAGAGAGTTTVCGATLGDPATPGVAGAFLWTTTVRCLTIGFTFGAVVFVGAEAATVEALDVPRPQLNEKAVAPAANEAARPLAVRSADRLFI